MVAFIGIVLITAILALVWLRIFPPEIESTADSSPPDAPHPGLQALARKSRSDRNASNAADQQWPARGDFAGLVEPVAIDLTTLAIKASGDDRLRREVEHDQGVRRKPEPPAPQEWPSREDFTGLIEPVSVDLQKLVRKRPGDAHLRREAGIKTRSSRKTDPQQDYLAKLAR
jgi:hypothetical protein